MTSRDRLLAALTGRQPDRLPATTHHLMPSFLRRCGGGIAALEFFDRFGLDAVAWTTPVRPDATAGGYFDPGQRESGPLESLRIVSDSWRVVEQPLPDPEYETIRHTFSTPRGALTMLTQSDEHTTWVSERLIKRKRDIDLIGSFATSPRCDVERVNREAAALGDRGLVRGHICGFDGYGQPGTWQDAACLVGIQDLILATYDDPPWVHELLRILQRRKLDYARSLAGAAYDLVELGGGDASSTVISPRIFHDFVAPYDAGIIAAAHDVGQRIVYHTCGGMMPLLPDILAMQPDAMETFTPPALGGDADLAAAREVLGDRVCMIGGFDQAHFFMGCGPEATRHEVRRCFEAAGRIGRYILSPSDHFFDADEDLLKAYAQEAACCTYGQERVRGG